MVYNNSINEWVLVINSKNGGNKMNDFNSEIEQFFSRINILDIKEKTDQGYGETYELWSVYFEIDGLKMDTDIIRSDFGTTVVEMKELKRTFKKCFNFEINAGNVEKVDFVFLLKIIGFLTYKIISRYEEKNENLFRNFNEVKIKNIQCILTADILISDEYMEVSFVKFDTTLTVKPFLSKRYDTEKLEEIFFGIVEQYCVKEEVSFLYSLPPSKKAYVIDEVLGQIILKEFKQTNKYKMLIMYNPELEKILQY
jgi:hypothetical protein